MMYLMLCAIFAVLFFIFIIGTFAFKKRKRTVFAIFSVIFFAAATGSFAAYYTGFGNAGKMPKEISEYCGEDLNELINATKLDFENVSEDIYEADGVSVCRRDDKIMYVDLKSDKYMIHGFCGKFSKKDTFYRGMETDEAIAEILKKNGFTEISLKYAETEFTDYDDEDICVYDSKGRILVFTIDENGKGKNIRYFPNPQFAETVVRSAVRFSEDALEFLREANEFNLIEREKAYAEEYGKGVTWQLKTVEVADGFILAERNGTEFKIYPLPQYMTKSALPDKNEYIEAIGLFGGYEDAWTVKNAVISKNITVLDNDGILGVFENKSSEITIEDENGKLHLTGNSNYGAYTADGYVEKINDTTYFYNGDEGDFYITLTESGIKVTTDTLKSFEGEYTVKSHI